MIKRIDLTRLQPKFIQLVTDYMKQHDPKIDQGDLAEIVGLQRTHLNALLNNKRPLSAYYLYQFIIRGVLTVDQIIDDSKKTKRELEFWKAARVCENVKMMSKIAAIDERGLDMDKFIDKIYSIGKIDQKLFFDILEMLNNKESS